MQRFQISIEKQVVEPRNCRSHHDTTLSRVNERIQKAKKSRWLLSHVSTNHWSPEKAPLKLETHAHAFASASATCYD